CQFIVAGNLIDSLEFERALQQFLNALEIAEYTKIPHLIGMSYMNIGICYEELKDYNNAAIHLGWLINILKNLNLVF
ncbi:tetratricopeptide repeat protein, partial [Bacillus velezensis]|nr:tetratricopeptide repeat protein [Bacillus velezensis]